MEHKEEFVSFPLFFPFFFLASTQDILKGSPRKEKMERIKELGVQLFSCLFGRLLYFCLLPSVIGAVQQSVFIFYFIFLWRYWKRDQASARHITACFQLKRNSGREAVKWTTGVQETGYSSSQQLCLSVWALFFVTWFDGAWGFQYSVCLLLRYQTNTRTHTHTMTIKSL